MDLPSNSNESESNRPRSQRGSRRNGGVPNRRAFLRAAGATAAAFGGFALGNPAVATDEYDAVVDIVADYGADDTGTEPINDALDAAVDDNTKVIFPDGEYWIDGAGYHNWDVSNLALVGEGNASLRPTADSNPVLLVLHGDRIRVENFTIDQTATDTSTGINVVADDGLVLRNLHFDGAGDGPGGPTDSYGDNGERHGPFNIVPGVTDPQGTGLIENVHMPDGTIPYYRKGGMWVANEHAGHLLIRRCSFEEFSDNAIYASGAGVPGRGEDGSVGVENCFFRNNTVSAIRLGTPGSYAENCTVVMDEYGSPVLPWGGSASRAAWLWYDFDGYLKNIDVISNHPTGHGFYYHWSQNRKTSVENCRVRMDADGTVGFNSGVPGEPITLRNVSVTGNAGTFNPVWFVEREFALENCCIHQTGANRDGVRAVNADGTIDNTLIDVTGVPIIEAGDSDVTVTNPREKGGCAPAQRYHPMEQS